MAVTHLKKLGRQQQMAGKVSCTKRKHLATNYFNWQHVSHTTG